LIFSLTTQLRDGSDHIMPHLTATQLGNILVETAPKGGLAERVHNWINSNDEMYTDVDFDGRPFTIVRM